MAILDSREWIDALTSSGIWRKDGPVKCETCEAMIRFTTITVCSECEFKQKNRHECIECGLLISKQQKRCIECKNKHIVPTMVGRVQVV